jgi:hypothetical protein
MSASGPGRAKRVRDGQRAFHLIVGMLLVISVYVPVEPGSITQAALQWVIAPAAVLAGVLMWQWPAVRRLTRRSRAARGA